jgi:hypothetical protein
MRIFLGILISFATANLAQANVVQSDQVWSKHRVTVCFAQPSQANLSFAGTGTQEYIRDGAPYTSQEKAVIQSVVEQQYTSASTGIHFQFLGDCKSSPTADLFLFKTFFSSTDLGGQTPSRSPEKLKKGRPFILMEIGRDGMSVESKLSYLDYLKLIVLHEFGHSAGLAHEHALPGALEDENCKVMPEGRNRPGQDFGNWTAIPKGYTQPSAYDPKSIMNGCWDQAVKISGLISEVRLSRQDRDTLKKLYAK